MAGTGTRGRLIATLLAAAVVVTACAAGFEKATEPQDAVTSLLEARKQGVTDAKIYRLYLPTDELASALASDSAAQGRKDPTPPWGDPVVYNETTATADVKILWERSKDQTGWPEATIFNVKFVKGAWVVADAQDTTAGAVPRAMPTTPPGAMPSTATP